MIKYAAIAIMEQSFEKKEKKNKDEEANIVV